MSKGLCVLCALVCVMVAADEHQCTAPPAGLKYATEPPCFFPTTLHEVPVRAVRQETQNSKIITFGLPEGTSLNHAVSSAIMLNAPGAKNGKDIARPYNPISPSTQTGSFDLLIKVYPEGLASKWADGLKPGDMASFKQLKGNVKKWTYPFGKTSITMLAGGTGVAPMYQALQPLLNTPGDSTQVHLIYGNAAEQDIMLKAELDALAEQHPERFKLTYVVGSSADAQVAGWDGETGWIDEDKVRRLAFPPSEDTVVWVCGVDAMYESLAGSRMKPLAPGSALHNIGYTEDMVWRS